MNTHQHTRHRRALTVATVAALAAALAVGGCSSTTPQGDQAQDATTVRLPGKKMVKVPSPFLYGGGVGYVQAAYVYDTLMWKKTDGTEIPWLATQHSASADGLTHRYTLREGVTWSDGKPFTASDVAFTFTYLEKHRSKLAPSVIARLPQGLLAQATAVDPTTVEFTLTRPDWTFHQFNGAGGLFIMPQHVWERVADPTTVKDAARLIGTGPYRLTSMDVAAGTYRYEARQDYFVGAPAVQVIEHVPVADELLALKTGQVDQAGGVGPGTGLREQAVQPFRDDADFDVVTATTGQTVTALYFNAAAGGALADPAFRRACARAINRQQLVEKGFGGLGTPGNAGLIPPGHPLHVDVEQYPFDRAAAEQALDAAGYRRLTPAGPRVGKDGKPLTFELLISGAQPKDVVEMVAADLAAVGVQAKVAVVDLPTFGQRRMAGKTQQSVNTFGGVATDEQPDGMGKVYASSSKALQSAQGYSNAAFDTAWKRQRAERDPSTRATIAAEMQKIVAQDVPLIPLVYPPLVTINRKDKARAWAYTVGGVGGLVPSVNNKVVFIGKVPS